MRSLDADGRAATLSVLVEVSSVNSAVQMCGVSNTTR